VAHGRRLIPGDLRLASHFADWAFFADPRSLIAQQFTLDVYKRRILAPDSQTQEKLAYLDQMVAVRQMQLEATQARFTD
ncbi:MAG: MBL fold metallo-hydrolase, partial [Myxococcota bacterium]